MNEALWRLKITAFLHDPPQKALLLGRGGGHENIAQSLIKAALGSDVSTEDWHKSKLADRIASAADRIDFPREAEACWWRRPILRHPLSGEIYDLSSLESLDTGMVNGWVEQRLTALKAASREDPLKVFMGLWRHLADDLKEGENPGNKLGALWDLLPADTRMPQHTIWHHNRVVSALAGALPEPAMLVMSIAPVQEFIACARKTRDLWAGSWILSYLAWQGMRIIAASRGPDAILFPDLRGQPLVDWWLKHELDVPGVKEPDRRLMETPSLPNRWVALLPAADADKVARECEVAIKQGWAKLSNDVRVMLQEDLGLNDMNSAQWARQGEWHEVYWSVLPWPDVTKGIPQGLDAHLTHLLHEDKAFDRLLTSFMRSGKYQPNVGTYYGRLHSFADRIHGSRKTLRNFTFGRSSEPGYKCTLCGEREPVTGDGINTSDYPAVMRFWRQMADRFSPGPVLQSDGQERLCTVCLTKRLALNILRATYGVNPQFPSTSEVAATSFKVELMRAAVSDGQLRQALADFIDSLPEKEVFTGSYVRAVGRALGLLKRHAPGVSWDRFASLDGEWLFPETYESKDAIQPLGDARSLMLERLLRLIGTAYERGVLPPTPYYALLFFDGDELGRWVAGSHSGLATIEQVLHPQAVSACRASFGEEMLEQKRPQSPALQGSLSANLLGFGLYVARYVVEELHQGKLVYAGGDDVLALVPMGEVLSLANYLREYFSASAVVIGDRVYPVEDALSRLNTEGKAVYLGMGNKATASVGIAIAHYKQPLSQVLESAREMEKRAKSELGRASFSVAVLKRSGERIVAGCKWSIANDLNVAELLSDVSTLLATEGGLSRRFLGRLEAEIHGLLVLPVEACQSRISYLLKRHMGPEIESKVSEIAGKILALFEHNRMRGADGWRETMKLLNLAAFMARYEREEVTI